MGREGKTGLLDKAATMYASEPPGLQPCDQQWSGFFPTPAHLPSPVRPRAVGLL